MTLFELLSHDERVIVLSNEGDGLIFTWNRSLTLQCWQETAGHNWEEVEVRTLSEEPKSFEEARAAAQTWY